MGVLGLADGVGLGRARSQPERLLVLRIYLLWRSVYIFMLDVKVQQLSLQASVDAPVNRVRDRCEPAASSRSIRRESGLPALHNCSWLPQGPFGTPACGASPRRSCEEGRLCPTWPCLLHPVLFAGRRQRSERCCRGCTCPASPLSHAIPASCEAFNGVQLQCTKACPCLVRI